MPKRVSKPAMPTTNDGIKSAAPLVVVVAERVENVPNETVSEN